VEAGVETPENITSKPGRKPLPDGLRIKYRDERVSMREEYWQSLERGARELNVLSLSGKNRGNPSWRAMIRFLCENMDWVVIAVRMIRSLDDQEREMLWYKRDRIGKEVKVYVATPIEQEYVPPESLALPAAP
jgi:hypothetical protein